MFLKEAGEVFGAAFDKETAVWVAAVFNAAAAGRGADDQNSGRNQHGADLVEDDFQLIIRNEHGCGQEEDGVEGKLESSFGMFRGLLEGEGGLKEAAGAFRMMGAGACDHGGGGVDTEDFISLLEEKGGLAAGAAAYFQNAGAGNVMAGGVAAEGLEDKFLECAGAGAFITGADGGSVFVVVVYGLLVRHLGSY